MKNYSLEHLISESGLKKRYVAECIGISEQVFGNKVKNRRRFKEEEITKLSQTLGYPERVIRRAIPKNKRLCAICASLFSDDEGSQFPETSVERIQWPNVAELRKILSDLETTVGWASPTRFRNGGHCPPYASLEFRQQ